MRFLSCLAAGFLMIVPGSAVAQATVGDLGPGRSSYYVGDNDFQSFLAPSNAQTLTDVSVAIADLGSAGSFKISVHRDVAGGPGAAVVTSDTFTTTTRAVNYSIQSFTLPTPMAVAPNERLYISVISTPNTALWALGDDYLDGVRITHGAVVPGRDTYFLAEFTTFAVSVPTLTEWAMILFGLGLAGSAVLMIQRRRLIA